MPYRELARVSRLYSVLSQINRALVSGNSRDELLNDICEVTARLGGFQIVCVSRIDPITKEVNSLARAGKSQKFLDEITIRADGGPFGQGPIGTCARTGELTLYTNLGTDPRTTAFHTRLAEYGLRAALALPLLLKGALWGVFSVYDANTEAFGDLETGLLIQAASDISFALDYLDKDAEREKALVELQESGNRFELLIEHAPAALAMFDTQMRYLAASRRWKTDYGLGDADVIGKSHYDLFPEIPARWKLAHQRGLAGEVIQAERDYFERVDGSVQYLRWDVRPWLTTVGGVNKVGGIVIFTEDTTEKERTELALRESEARYRLVSENGSDVIWLFELASNRFVYVSPSVERLRGYSVAEVREQSMREALTPESYEVVARDLPERIAAFVAGDDSAKIQTHEVDQPSKDGRIVPTEVVTTLIADSQRRVTHIQGVTRDITKRRLVELALRENRAKLDAALASMTDAVFISDLNGRLIDFNDAFVTFHRFKYKGECTPPLAEYSEFLEVSMADGTLAPLEQWAVPRALRGEVATNAEYRLRRKDTGETWIGSYSFSPIRDANGSIIGSVVVGRDITQEKLAEQSLIEHANRLSAALEVSPVPMALVDHQGTFRFLNTAFVKTFGYEPSEIPTINHWRAIAYPDPEYRKRIVNAWQAEHERVKKN